MAYFPLHLLLSIGIPKRHRGSAGDLPLSPSRPARSKWDRNGLLTIVMLGGIIVPLAGRQAIAGAETDAPDVEIDETIPSELLGAIDDALNQPERPNDLSDLIFRAEEISEQRLANEGTAEKLLTSAGVGEVAKDELVGIVIDVEGKPVSGAKIDAWSWFPGNETASDEQGLFRLKGLDPREGAQVVVTKEGYSPRFYPKRASGRKDWIIILRNETYFEGTVLGTDKKPVEGATVRATCGPFDLDGGVMSEFPIETTSTKDGRYRLYVMPNLYDIQASAPGRGVLRKTNVPLAPDQSEKLEIQLERGVRFEARVVDSETEQPVAGFRLFKWQPPRISGRSDEKGIIVFEDLIPGEIEMQCGGGEKLPLQFNFDVFGHGPFGRWWSADAIHDHQKFQIDPRRNWQRNFDALDFDLQLGMEPVTIVVEQGVAVSGQVTDPTGKPVEGATVAPALTGTGNSLTGDTRYSVRTDKDGKYRVVLPASNQAEYNLVVHDGDYQEWRHWANGVSDPIQTEPGQVIENLDLELTVPAVIRGRVTANGKPVADRQVRAHDFDKLENRYYDPTVRTAADGTFELKFVRPGKHYVQAHPFWLDAQDAKQGSEVVEVEAGEVLEDIELQVDANR